MGKDRQERHVYDLELKSMLNNYAREIANVKLDNPKLSPQYFVRRIKLAITTYCNYKKIQFNKAVQVIVEPNEKDLYDQLLGLSLVFFDAHKIPQYLNYQLRKYENFANLPAPFIDSIEFIVVEMVKWASPFDNSNRLKIIMDWVTTKRDLPTPPRIIESTSKWESPSAPKIIIPNPKWESSSEPKIIKPTSKIFRSNLEIDLLIWRKENSLLKSLSVKLQAKYTSRKYDFEAVFNSHKKIVWKASIESWVYLMYRLTSPPYECVTTTRGSRPYFKVGVQFFDFGDEITSKKRNFSSILNNIISRSKDKHKDTTDKIDLILKFIFDKKIIL